MLQVEVRVKGEADMDQKKDVVKNSALSHMIKNSHNNYEMISMYLNILKNIHIIC